MYRVCFCCRTEEEDEERKPKPDPVFEVGKTLPPKFGEFPPELYGKPIEDLDPFYHNKYVRASTHCTYVKLKSHLIALKVQCHKITNRRAQLLASCWGLFYFSHESHELGSGTHILLHWRGSKRSIFHTALEPVVCKSATGQIQIKSKSTWTSSNPNQIQSQIFPSNPNPDLNPLVQIQIHKSIQIQIDNVMLCLKLCLKGFDTIDYLFRSQI